jgi:PhzF family phenazine biosynthesis protein
MPHPIYTVDAFTSEPFCGNPAAVCLLQEEADPAWMQIVAREMNLSETAFLVPSADDCAFGLRWFTPKAEVALCGHATIASSHVLWSQGYAPEGSTLRFATQSGELTAVRAGDGWIELDFPALEPHEAAAPMELIVALGAQPVYTGRSRHDILCELASEEEVRKLTPDFTALGRVPDARGIIVTARPESASSGYDFVSRFFAPSVGVNEDPATGSAHCVLAPYWTNRLGKTELVGFQASERTGRIRVGIAGDRVKLRGQAVLITKGELLV